MHGRTSDNAMALARQVTGMLRRREQVFGRGVVNEIQWEMLLHLLIEGAEHGSLCERSLLVGGGIAAADAARQLDQLVEQGLVWRVGGARRDERRQIHMTGSTRSRILRVLGGIGTLADEVRSGFAVAATTRAI